MSQNAMTPRMPGAQPATPAKPVEPWWKFGHVWLVISGPAIVVVAGLTTAWIALSSPDPVVDADYYRKGIEINKTLAGAQPQVERSLSPAMQARNHAATPTDDLPAKPAVSVAAETASQQ